MFNRNAANKCLSKLALIILNIIVIACICYFAVSSSSFSLVAKSFSLICCLFILVVVYGKKRFESWICKLINRLGCRNTLILIILLGFSMRLLWILLVPTIPISDFGLMYEYAKEIQQGNFTGFHNYAYFARFAHDTITVLYFSIFYNLKSNPLIIIKFMNVLFSTLAIYYMYKIVEQIYDVWLGLLAAFLLAIFPPFIMYNSQTMSENIAITFYLISVYYFMLVINKKKKFHGNELRNLCFCGLALAMANMFRMVGSVFLIAYIMYLILFRDVRKLYFLMPFMLLTYFIPIFLISSILIYNGITETHLWNSKEPIWTSVLKGTNFESNGHWNVEDAKLPEIYNHDPDKITQASKQIIKERLLNASPQKISTFYLYKFGSEWADPDMSAYEWATKNIPESSPTANLIRKLKSEILIVTTLFYLFLLYFSIKSLLRNRDRPEEISFFLLLFCGFVILLLITEAQARYAFVISWIFIILAIGGLKGRHVTDFKIQRSRSIKYSDLLRFLLSNGLS
ncbi:membrane protein [Desulfosporosinus sp. BG]|nr:membrane protein [Desulfosporosinus sp. BG]